jgi:hypothetical protein
LECNQRSRSDLIACRYSEIFNCERFHCRKHCR